MGLLDNQSSQQYYNNVNVHGQYQFVSLEDIINQFMVIYVGEDKIISKASRVDVAFHAQRGLAEMSFDTFKSVKSLEIVLPSTLQMTLPQDYVGYVKVSWSGDSGIKHVLQPASKTSNPTKVAQNSDGEYTFNGSTGALLTERESTTWSNYKTNTPAENSKDDYEDEVFWPLDGRRYGLNPQNAQINGSFYIDENKGKMHFSSNISGKTVILDYISDSLGDNTEMKVHKFAEEAMYSWIAYGILSGKSNIPEYQVNRFKRERFAAVRKAKLRLSNIKLEEITQILRGKSKQIKH
tara:strand:- start:110 stop:991 length:882 start_codon:yes stop_codon:yes gene_type:complete